MQNRGREIHFVWIPNSEDARDKERADTLVKEEALRNCIALSLASPVNKIKASLKVLVYEEIFE